MDAMQQVEMLQNAYAGALADSVLQFEKEGVLAAVTARKKAEQAAMGKARAAQFGITRPEEVFSRLGEVFGCAEWEIVPEGEGFTATTGKCRLCAIAKRMGASSPCALYCLNPMEGMVKGLRPEAGYEVKGTLWAGERCEIRVLIV